MAQNHPASIASALLLAASVFIVIRWIYRLTLHPLAGIPGPRLAALSSLYGLTYDWTHRDYIRNFAKWHEQYGPVIRIEPNHVHVIDTEAYNKVFQIGSKYDREPGMYSAPVLREGFFNKLRLKEAKPHRDLYQPYFSKSAIIRLEPMIREHLLVLLDKIASMSRKKDTIDISRAFTAFTADTIMRYSYVQPFGALQRAGFIHPLLENGEQGQGISSTQLSYVPRFAGAFLDFLSALPRSWLGFNPVLQAMLVQNDASLARIKEIREKPPPDDVPSVFQAALNPDRSRNQPILSDQALSGDAITFFVAGTDTTAHTLVIGTWHLYHNPKALAALRTELDTALPHLPDLSPRPTPNLPLDWPALESLPYLTAVIKESLRLSYGVPGKIPRVVPPHGAELGGRFLPGGTAVSMCCLVYHHHRAFYREDPDAFIPERWLRDPAEMRAGKEEQAFMPFSRGSRGCLGQNLAWAELYYMFAYLYRAFELEVVDTTEEDMKWHDAFVVAPYGHLKVKARQRRV